MAPRHNTPCVSARFPEHLLVCWGGFTQRLQQEAPAMREVIDLQQAAQAAVECWSAKCSGSTSVARLIKEISCLTQHTDKQSNCGPSPNRAALGQGTDVGRPAAGTSGLFKHQCHARRALCQISAVAVKRWSHRVCRIRPQPARCWALPCMLCLTMSTYSS